MIEDIYKDNFFNCDNCFYKGEKDVCKECKHGDCFSPDDELVERMDSEE